MMTIIRFQIALDKHFLGHDFVILTPLAVFVKWKAYQLPIATN